MNQNAPYVSSDQHALSQRSGRKQVVRIAAAAITAALIGSVILSRDVNRRLIFSRAAMIGIAAELAMLAVLERRKVLRIVRTFFAETSHSVNLAIFRMAVFWGILYDFHFSSVLSFSRMPSGLRFAPWGMSALLPHLLIDPRWVKIAGALLLIFSATGFVGFFSRTSALACTILGFYLFGIPNFYGKVDHDHHLLWFAAILAVSPCGDFLALDAVLAAWRGAGRGTTNLSLSSRAYALPLRFVMLLMGLIYFFPGFWKLWQSGFDWFLTDNLPRQLHLFWIWSFDGLWLPSFRVDRHLLLCQIAAGATVLFELTFILLIFHRKLRVFAALGGLIFHTTTNWLMKISFLSLRVCYVALFDWSQIFAALGHALYREDLLLLYDGNSLSARRIVGFVRAWDIFGRVRYVSSEDKANLALQRDCREEPNGRSTDFSALCELAQRVPLVWPVIPVFRFWLAAARLSAIHAPPVRPRTVQAVAPANDRCQQLGWITVVGCMLLVGIICGGINRHINAWPFACYPTFSLPPPEGIVSLSVVAVGPFGEEKPITNFGFPYHRFYGLSKNILAIQDPVARNDRLVLLWARAAQTTPQLRTTAEVKFYVENLWIDPDRWGSNPRDKRLLFTWHPPLDGSVPQLHSNVYLSDTEWQ